jgi:hypothetical protein
MELWKDETSVILIKTGSSRKLPSKPLEPQPFLPRLCHAFAYYGDQAEVFPAEYNSALHFDPGSLLSCHICLLPPEYYIMSTTLFLSISIYFHFHPVSTLCLVPQTPCSFPHSSFIFHPSYFSQSLSHPNTLINLILHLNP